MKIYKFENIITGDCYIGSETIDNTRCKMHLYIDNSKSSYNACKKAGNTKGRKHSKKAKEKISKSSITVS